jgi:periplasmic copper chaperone A
MNECPHRAGSQCSRQASRPDPSEDTMRSVVFRFARLSLATTFVLMVGTTADTQEFRAGSVVIEQPWIRATPAGAKVAGGYMTIVNSGSEPDRLIGGSLPRSGRFQIHDMKMDGGQMTMREIGGLEIKPGEKLELRPGGYHIMFSDLNGPLNQGETVKGQLRFEKAGTVEIQYKVEAVGAGQGGHQGH